MPTKLEKDVFRELPRDELIVRIAPEGIYTRPKRTRQWWGPIPWNKVHWQCQQVQVHEAIAERAERKLMRRVTRGRV
jgi:hypothetical protein